MDDARQAQDVVIKVVETQQADCRESERYRDGEKQVWYDYYDGLLASPDRRLGLLLARSVLTTRIRQEGDRQQQAQVYDDFEAAEISRRMAAILEAELAVVEAAL